MQAKARVFCPKNKLNESLLRGKDCWRKWQMIQSQDGIIWGLSWGQGPHWEEELCWRQDSRGGMPAQGEGGDSLEALCLPGQTSVPLTQHCRWLYCCLSSGAASQYSVESIGFLLSWASEGFENFLSTTVLLTVGVLEMQR